MPNDGSHAYRIILHCFHCESQPLFPCVRNAQWGFMCLVECVHVCVHVIKQASVLYPTGHKALPQTLFAASFRGLYVAKIAGWT